MIPLTIVPNAEVAPPEELEGALEGRFSHVLGLPNGTEEGRPVVAVVIQREGEKRLAFTTLALFLSAADALKARYGDPREDMP